MELNLLGAVPRNSGDAETHNQKRTRNGERALHIYLLINESTEETTSTLHRERILPPKEGKERGEN